MNTHLEATRTNLRRNASTLGIETPFNVLLLVSMHQNATLVWFAFRRNSSVARLRAIFCINACVHIFVFNRISNEKRIVFQRDWLYFQTRSNAAIQVFHRDVSSKMSVLENLLCFNAYKRSCSANMQIIVSSTKHIVLLDASILSVCILRSFQLEIAPEIRAFFQNWEKTILVSLLFSQKVFINYNKVASHAGNLECCLKTQIVFKYSFYVENNEARVIRLILLKWSSILIKPQYSMHLCMRQRSH